MITLFQFEGEVDFSNYQAIYTIPPIQSWMDNLLTTGDWNTEIHAQTISVASGLPWINSRLSRAPVNKSLKNIQLSSHPLIHKTTVDNLASTEPILLIKSTKNEQLSIGERDLVSRANKLFESPDIQLFEIDPSEINQSTLPDEIVNHCSDSNQWFFYEGFETNDNNCGFHSDNGFVISNNWKEITVINIPDTVGGTFELSYWNFVNKEKYGMPFYKIEVVDQQNNFVETRSIDSRTFLDTQDGWLRCHLILNLQGGYKVKVRGQGRYDMCMDELLLRNVQDLAVCFDLRNGQRSINNYVVNMDD